MNARSPHQELAMDERGSLALTPLDVEQVRAEFPVLHQQVNGQPLVYLDNAATTQKPRAVIEAVTRFYEHDCANVHRGVHTLSQRATDAYEAARATVQRQLNAASATEIVFLRGATEAVNLVAQSFLRPRLQAGDEILVSGMEHHANIVPWQLLCQQSGAQLRVIPVTDAGELELAALDDLLTARTRLVAVTHISNALGTVNPVAEIIDRAHERGVPVLVDGAQALPHGRVDVQALDADFYVFSGHKVYGPSGIGALYAKAAHLQAMPPWQGGGEMIRSVTFEKTTFAPPPERFEAGTPNIEGAIGLAAAIEWLNGLGAERVAAHEQALLAHATEALETVPGLRLIGTAERKEGIISFVMEGAHPHDIGTILDHQGIAIRTGHHCAQPLMRRFGVPATARASFAVYNTRAEVDRLVAGLAKVKEVLG